MLDTDLKYYTGVDGNPDNNSAPVGGDIDTGTALTEDDLLIQDLTILDTEELYRGVGYRKNESSDTLEGAKYSNRAGGNPPSSSGLPTLKSSSNEDTGKCWMVYRHGGSFIPGGLEITLNGVTPVSGLVTMDEDTDFILEYELGIPKGDISLEVNGEKLAVVWGNPTASRPGTFQANTLFDLAVADAQDQAISCSDRKTDPGDVGAFSRATRWPGQDNGIAIPGTDLEPDKFVGYCLRARVPEALPKPPSNDLLYDVNLSGNPVA